MVTTAQVAWGKCPLKNPNLVFNALALSLGSSQHVASKNVGGAATAKSMDKKPFLFGARIVFSYS